MVSYEVSIGFVIVTVLLCAGSLNLSEIVMAQRESLVLRVALADVHHFIISALAETNRSPFDLPEGESEIVAGYFVEYSSMPFALFFLGKYISMILMSGMTTVLFLGGNGCCHHLWISTLSYIPGVVIFSVRRLGCYLSFCGFVQRCRVIVMIS